MATVYLVPNGAGYHNEFIAQVAPYIWQCLDDAPGSADVLTVRADAVDPADRQSVVLGTFGGGGVITDVTLTGRGRSPGSASTVRLLVRIGGTDYESGNKTLPTSIGDITNSWATNPATGVAWTIQDLYALEAGLYVVSFGFPAISFYKLYATVTYTPPPAYVVNSTTFYGVIAGWQRVPKRKSTSGAITWQNYALHTWEIAQMEVSDYLILQAAHGQRLTSLQTVSLADSRIGATYTAAEIIGLSGEQTGRRMTGVQVQFRVDVS